MSRNYQDKDIKLLWGLAAARCGYPDCRLELVLQATERDNAAVIGKIAHIVAHSNSGPRADTNYSKDLRDRYENLILLCPTHHDMVDGHSDTYTVQDLRQWKLDHEAWVRGSLAREMPAVGFAELEITTKAILSAPSEPVTAFTITDPTQKMIRNQLTDNIRFHLTMGLGKAREVEKFVEHIASMDWQFPERLKAGFVAEYSRRWSEGLEGDALFEALREFASAGSQDFRKQAAGLAVLAYLFEKCEVFQA